MRNQAQTVTWFRCIGRDGWSSPLDIRPDMAAEALNVHFYDGGLCTKRAGSTSITVSGHSNHNALFGGYVPGQDETARELWMVDDSATNLIRRMAGGSTFSSLTLPENITAANDKEISWAVINGKLFIAYNSASNRLKVFDPGLSTTTIRFAGMKKPAAPTTATMGGSGLSFTRSYKVAFTEVRSSVTVRRSLLSDVDTETITDDAGVTVMKPATVSESETHWEIYASDTATGQYYLLTAAIAVGTTTYDDTNSSIPTTTAAPVDGANTPFPSCKFIYSDGARLYGFGVWETSAGDSITPLAGTLYFSPVLDSSGIHDEERVSNTTTQIGRIAVGRNAGGVDRGLNGLGNTVYAFQSLGIYAFQPTGNDDVPLRRIVVSKELGAVNNQSIVQAIDDLGRPALYFLDPALGPYRISRDGLQWCGKDVSDIWATVNLSAANVVAHGVYYPAKYQIWWWVSTGSSDDPDTRIVFDCTLGRFQKDEQGDLGVRGGWAKWTGPHATANRCSTMMSSSLGATMGRALVPYVGSGADTVLYRCDTGTQDNGSNYQAYLQSGAGWAADWPLHRNKALVKSYLEAGASSGVTITQTTIRNTGDETNRTSTCLLTASGSETEVLKQFEGGEMVDAFMGQIRIGDASAANTSFTLNRWEGLVESREER